MNQHYLQPYIFNKIKEHYVNRTIKAEKRERKRFELLKEKEAEQNDG